MLLQPTVFASGIGPEDPFSKLHTGGAVVEKIPAAVGIAQVHMRREQRMEGVEKYFSKKLRKRKTLSEADLPLKASVLTV